MLTGTMKKAIKNVHKNNEYHVVNRWQARREGDRNMRAGLIPSRALQERRIILERQTKDKGEDDASDNLSELNNNLASEDSPLLQQKILLLHLI